MFGFGLWEILLVGVVIVFALFSGCNIATSTRQAGRLTGLWLKVRQKLTLLRFFR